MATSKQIKEATGEFDVHNIRRLTLQGQSLQSLGAILDCTSLVDLDCSMNMIEGNLEQFVRILMV